MKKLLLTCMLSATLALGLTACSQSASNSGGNSAGETQTSEQSYAVSAISAVNIITAINTESSSTAAVKSKLASTVTDAEKLSSLDEYMAIVEGILSDSSYGVTNAASDRAEYDVKSTLSFADMSGATVEYVMYYNETNVREYTERDGWETETERRSDIDGILIIEGVEYAISGVTEGETEGSESEWETRFTVTLGSASYIVIRQECEEDNGESEIEYEYSQYENNALVKRSTFSYEQEKDETEIEMSVYENGTTTKFYFERETERGVEYTTIKIGSSGSSEKYRVYVTQNSDGSYSYTYTYIGK